MNLPRFLDPEIVRMISLENRFSPGGEGSTANTEPWVWGFLKACLATAVGYDEARAIVQDVQQSRTESASGPVTTQRTSSKHSKSRDARLSRTPPKDTARGASPKLVVT